MDHRLGHRLHQHQRPPTPNMPRLSTSPSCRTNPCFQNRFLVCFVLRWRLRRALRVLPQVFFPAYHARPSGFCRNIPCHGKTFLQLNNLKARGYSGKKANGLEKRQMEAGNWKRPGDTEQTIDQMTLGENITLFSSFHLPFANHVHRLVPCQCAPRRLEGKETQSGPGAAFDNAMILLDKIVQVFDLAQFTHRRSTFHESFAGFSWGLAHGCFHRNKKMKMTLAKLQAFS
jgi:hypothetical protein